MKNKKQKVRAWGLVLLVLGGLSGLALANDKDSGVKAKKEAQQEKGKSSEKQASPKKQSSKRPLKTSTVMTNLTKPNCNAIRDLLEKEPKTSEDWDKLIEHSEVLSEVSFILMDDGRCPDYVWEGAASLTLRNCAKAIISASEKRNIVVARGAFEKLTQSCTACHDAHKEKTSLLQLVE